jgi:two-component Ni(II)/redox sensor kinase NrsS
MYRVLLQANWVALEREIESTAGTLHDSLEPMLPVAGDPAAALQQIFPELCVVGRPCDATPTFIQRHTTGLSDRTTYYIRLFDGQGNLLAFSPQHPVTVPPRLNPAPWQTIQTDDGIRYHQFTTILHSVHTHPNSQEIHQGESWGYLQVGRTLAALDAERQRLRWTLVAALPLALALVAVSSWWLSGLAMQPIYRAYQQQQQFIANAAHELRSPLASLIATVEALMRLPDERLDLMPSMLQTVERQGRRLSQLVADLLWLASLERDASVEAFQPCCLNDVVTDLTEELAELAAATEVSLHQHVPETEIYVAARESQLYRLLENLIANAIQYTPAGGDVTVSLAGQDRTAIVSVRDTGIGIPPEEQQQIFERFYRVHSDRSRKTGGTGLGLAIAQAIAHRHHGQITVTSQVGQGSVFQVCLPSSVPVQTPE